jgi:two-component system heavy metal sensor histidine kinase CusS
VSALRSLLTGFRGRLVLAATLLTVATLGGAFVAVYEVVSLSQQRRLDRRLLGEATHEAAALARGETGLLLTPASLDAGELGGFLPEYAAVFAAGRLETATPGFATTAAAVQQRALVPGQGLDFWHGSEHLRGVVVGVPGQPQRTLLLAVPRTSLDGEEAFLIRAMQPVFLLAVAVATLVAWMMVRRMTRVHQRIAQVVHSVAAGNLSPRVGPAAAPVDLAAMGRDVDDLVERLSVLVQSQQQFIAHAAHELRSPLTTLYGELSLALRRPRTAAEYQRVVEQALGSARKLKLLAEDLLVLARVGRREGSGEPAGLREVLEAALEQVRGEAERKNVRVHIAVAGASTPAVRGRSSELQRLFRNLIENAVHHSPEGVGAEVHVCSEVNGAVVTTTVTDEGAGVAPSAREHIFEPFFRGAEDRAGDPAGAGLGLPIARHLAELHGGTVELGEGPAHDHEKSGARFVVTLPVA